MSGWRTMVLLLLCSACGGDGEPSVRSARAGVVSGTIHYDGRLPGSLRIGVFSSFPPRGAPLALVDIEAPVVPQSYRIEGVPEGRYYVLAVVDADAEDGDAYHPTMDAGGAFGDYRSPMSVRVSALDGAQRIDVRLHDPDPSSPWARPGYR